MKAISGVAVLVTILAGGLYLTTIGVMGVYFNNTFLDYVFLLMGLLTINSLMKGYFNSNLDNISM